MWTSIFSIALTVLNFILDKSKASAATRAAFLDFVSKSKDDGIISLEAHDKFQEQREKLAAQEQAGGGKDA